VSIAHESQHVTDCVYCGKRSYTSRRHARVARQRVPSHKGLRAYRCRANPAEVWHLGRLPQAAAHGVLTASEVYDPSEAPHG
jgi:hypothetical protein